MAKKKDENKLSYMQMPLPEGRRYSKMTKLSFSGLNKRQTIDTGYLSMEKNISTAEAPYLTPSPNAATMPTVISTLNVTNELQKPINMFGFGEVLIVAYLEKDADFETTYNGKLKILYIKLLSAINKEQYTSTLTEVEYFPNSRITDDDATGKPQEISGVSPEWNYTKYYYNKDFQTFFKHNGTDWQEINPCQSMVQFNAYYAPTDPVSGDYVRKILIFPDRKSIDYTYNANIKTFTNNVSPYKPTTATEEDVKYWWKNTYNNTIWYWDTTLTPNGWAQTTNDFKISDLDVTLHKYKAEAGTPPVTGSDHRYYWMNTTDKEVYQWNYNIGKWEQVYLPPYMPPIEYATVYMSRLFGVGNGRIYASGFNNYANWNLDTIDGYNESNAWVSPAQSNTKADGAFTGITTFQNHVICFKKDFMHEIYNNKNPFRVQDIYAEGTIDNRTIQEVDGNLIFVSEDNVKMYTGSNPRIIGDNLNISKLSYAVSGTDNRNYYLYCRHTDNSGNDLDSSFYVFDTVVGQWSEREIFSKVLNFANTKYGLYMLCENGKLQILSTNTYPANRTWAFETDLITNNTVDITHIKKIQMLADFGVYYPSTSWQQGSIKVYILYDNETFNASTSHLVYDSGTLSNKRIPIRVKPRQTANYGFKIHVEGTGYVKLYELEIFIESGGELYG